VVEATGLSAERRAGEAPVLGVGLFGASTRATLASIVGSAPGFFVPVSIAAVFGASAGTDAFFLALAICSFIANTLAATTQQAAIPFLIQAQRELPNLGRLLGEITVVLLALAAVPTIAVNVAVPLVSQVWSGWAAIDSRLVNQLLWAFTPYIVCSIVAGVYSGALNAQHSYVRVAVSPAFRSLIVLAALLTVPIVGLYALLIGYLIGELVRVVYLFNALNPPDRTLHLAWPEGRRAFEFLRAALPQVMGSGVLALVPLLDRIMATRVGPGSVSLLDYADRLWQVPLGFALSGLMVTTLSHWSERFYNGGSIQSLSRATARLASLMLALLVPAAVLFVLWRQQLVGLLFWGGKLSVADRAVLADTLAALAMATPVYVAGLIYTRAFLILSRTHWLLWISLVQLAIKAALNSLLLPLLGLVGIGISTAIMYSVSSVLLIVIFHSRLAGQARGASV
jgi:putative peptidoglycan lipid II flippase